MVDTEDQTTLAPQQFSYCMCILLTQAWAAVRQTGIFFPTLLHWCSKQLFSQEKQICWLHPTFWEWCKVPVWVLNLKNNGVQHSDVHWIAAMCLELNSRNPIVQWRGTHKNFLLFIDQLDCHKKMFLFNPNPFVFLIQGYLLCTVC